MENGVEIIWNGSSSETDYAGQLQIRDAMILLRVDHGRRAADNAAGIVTKS